VCRGNSGGFMGDIYHNLRKTNWWSILIDQLGLEFLANLGQIIESAFENEVVYPPREVVFRCLELVSPESVRVIVLGQDPYHGGGQAEGLSFSVPKGTKLPPSLKNIFKELERFNVHNNCGSLLSWAKQNVLLLNTVLTVHAGAAGSHRGIGWETFTDCILSYLNKQDNLIFLLWGKDAQQKIKLLNNQKHIILQAPHPSPLSAHRGFFGCDHFRLTNSHLRKMGHNEIDWSTS